VSFTADALDIATAEEAQEALARLGFAYRPPFTTTLAVRAMPSMLRQAHAEAAARDVLHDCASSGATPRADRTAQTNCSRHWPAIPQCAPTSN